VKTWDLSSLDLEPHAPAILASADDARAIALAIPAGERLQEHQVHERAWVLIVAGAVEVTTPAGVRVVGAPGLVVTFEPGERHAVRALSDTRLLLLLTPWPGPGHPGSPSLEAKARARAGGAERPGGVPVPIAGGAARATAPVGETAGSGPENRRQETARQRDVTAGSRDLAADARDRVAGQQEEALMATEESRDSTIRALLVASGGVRDEAAADRADAASDRQRAAADRAQAGADSGQARIELEHAQLDSLTGAYMRDLGLITLQNEIDRSRRSGEPFVLAFVDVDGLKELNDREGHAAGDALLRDVVGALKSRLRSYDPIVRVGGDEFVCGFSNTELAACRPRVEAIRAALELGPAAGTFTVGLAGLMATDTLDDLTARADADMYTQKQVHRRGAG
jgi:diguanylate cyclase (GGDEF)-like protein